MPNRRIRPAEGASILSGTGFFLPERQALLAAAFDEAAEPMVVTDAHGRVVAANSRFATLLGVSAEQLAGHWPDLLPPPEDSRFRFFARVRQSLRAAGAWSGEALIRTADGSAVAVWLSVSRILRDPAATAPDASPDALPLCALYYLAIVTDITDRKRQSDHFQKMAHYDALTGLPNRALLRDRLRVAVAAAQRTRRSGALLFIDLDRFKWVNDTLGHEAGDVLLCETARRLTRCVRDSDTVARLGGDEFVIVLSGLVHEEDAEIVARHVLAALSRAYDLPGDNDVYVSGSIGIAVFPRDGDSYEELLQHSDIAMYRAKDSGRNSFRFYTPVMNEQALRRLRGEAELRHALEKDEFRLFYQPILELGSKKVVGAEALLRWNKPGEGMLPPAAFLALAEETGAIVPIGNWVVEEAVRRLIAWQQQGITGFRLAINLSPRQLRNDQVIESARDQLVAAGIDPSMLELEISEEILKSDNVYSLETLKRIIRSGVSLSLDDFGQGYLSLQHLRRYPIRSLKIDRLFVRNVTSGSEDAAFTEAMIALAHSLNIKIVAEGVEDAGQSQFLEQRNCDFAQGFLFSHPLAERDFLDYLQGRLTPEIT